MNSPRRGVSKLDSPLLFENNFPHLDHWIAASWLQKAIRRGDTELADEAASALHSFRGKNTFRRLLIIAFEDVGIGSIAAAAAAVSAFCEPARQHVGQDEAVAARELARTLAVAQKDRSAELLISGVNSHPALVSVREDVSRSDLDRRLAIIANDAATLHQRAAATVASVGLGQFELRTSIANLDKVLSTFSDLEVPSQLLRVIRHAASRAREPMALVLPLLWRVLPLDRHQTIADPMPATRIVHGIPLYAFDKHTRLGNRAIRHFARENMAVRRILEANVAAPQRPAAACMAAFYADAAPIADRLAWADGANIERLGREGDLFRAGVPLEIADPMVRAVRDNIDHLNDIRERLFLNHLRAVL